jgi:hypothetical protein
MSGYCHDSGVMMKFILVFATMFFYGLSPEVPILKGHILFGRGKRCQSIRTYWKVSVSRLKATWLYWVTQG